MTEATPAAAPGPRLFTIHVPPGHYGPRHIGRFSSSVLGGWTPPGEDFLPGAQIEPFWLDPAWCARAGFDRPFDGVQIVAHGAHFHANYGCPCYVQGAAGFVRILGGTFHAPRGGEALMLGYDAWGDPDRHHPLWVDIRGSVIDTRDSFPGGRAKFGVMSYSTSGSFRGVHFIGDNLEQHDFYAHGFATPRLAESDPGHIVSPWSPEGFIPDPPVWMGVGLYVAGCSFSGAGAEALKVTGRPARRYYPAEWADAEFVEGGRAKHALSDCATYCGPDAAVLVERCVFRDYADPDSRDFAGGGAAVVVQGASAHVTIRENAILSGLGEGAMAVGIEASGEFFDTRGKVVGERSEGNREVQIHDNYIQESPGSRPLVRVHSAFFLEAHGNLLDRRDVGESGRTSEADYFRAETAGGDVADVWAHNADAERIKAAVTA